MTPPDSQNRQDEDVDAFLTGILRAVQWAQENTRLVAVGAAVLVAAVAAGVYYQNYQEDVRQQAASRLQELQTQLQSQSPPDTLARSVQNYISRFSDTRYGDEARLLMARLQLNQDQWQNAISTLQPVVNQYPADVPTGYAARNLLAAANAGAGNVERALQLYGDLAENAQFAFQRHEAAADRARLLAREGRLQEAEQVYARLVEQADTTAAGVASQDIRTYRMELGEIRARLAGRGGSGAGSGGAARGREGAGAADTASGASVSGN